MIKQNITYDQAKQLENYVDYGGLIMTFIRIMDSRDPLDPALMKRYDKFYTLFPSSGPLVLLDDIAELYELNVIARNLDDGFSLERYWDLIQLKLK